MADDLKKTFGAFMRSAMRGLDTAREVVVQKSKEAKVQLDVAMLKRKRREALADLGEVVAKLAGDGKLTEEDHPELSSPLAALEAIDERIASEEERARGGGGAGAASEEDVLDTDREGG